LPVPAPTIPPVGRSANGDQHVGGLVTPHALSPIAPHPPWPPPPHPPPIAASFRNRKHARVDPGQPKLRSGASPTVVPLTAHGCPARRHALARFQPGSPPSFRPAGDPLSFPPPTPPREYDEENERLLTRSSVRAADTHLAIRHVVADWSRPTNATPFPNAVIHISERECGVGCGWPPRAKMAGAC